MNKWIGMGRLTKDAELRHTQNDKVVCSFTVAVNRRYFTIKKKVTGNWRGQEI